MADPEVPNRQPIKTQRDKDTETVEGASPCLQQLWEATLDGAQLMVQLRRDLGRLDPISWHDGVLSLKAPASDVLRRVQRMAPVIVHDLQPTAPVPLRVVEIV